MDDLTLFSSFDFEVIPTATVERMTNVKIGTSNRMPNSVV